MVMLEKREECRRKKVLLTIIDPPGEFFTGSKESLARKLKSSSSPAFSSGVFFKGAEDNGGNSIGELFPLVHMCSDLKLIKEREGKPKRLDKVISLGAEAMCVSQGIYVQQDQQDVGHGRSHNYETNSIILVGLKVPGTSMASFAFIVICSFSIPSFCL